MESCHQALNIVSFFHQGARRGNFRKKEANHVTNVLRGRFRIRQQAFVRLFPLLSTRTFVLTKSVPIIVGLRERHLHVELWVDPLRGVCIGSPCHCRQDGVREM